MSDIRPVTSPSRRHVLRDAAALTLGAIALGGAGVAAADAAKMPQKAVAYQDHPKAGHGCNSCKSFQPPTACKTVEGPVAPAGWCSLYKSMS